MRDQNKNRKQIVRTALIMIAVLPIFLGTVQALHFCYWLFDLDYGQAFIFRATEFSFPFLTFALVISLYERFCISHRITILSTLYANSSYYFMDLFPSISRDMRTSSPPSTRPPSSATSSANSRSVNSRTGSTHSARPTQPSRAISTTPTRPLRSTLMSPLRYSL